uniref:Acylglycerol kinase, mitochondrial n=1 Tax=Rhinopithecus bieti TaxID=61621 RepID=A0A2K6M1R0_RHIBE
NHWKKAIAGLCLLTWGGQWLYEKHCDNLLRRAACEEAQVFGNQLIPPNAQVKKETVFLSPAACKGKARTLFEKNATDYEVQAKKFLELMENTYVIIVAGGDGTLQEVVTGVLRRTDEATFSKIPIGFIPLGETSSLSHNLLTESGNKLQHITDATLAIVNGETVPFDVLLIKGEKEQPVPLKIKVAHFFSTLKEWPQTRETSILYMGPTERPPNEPKETPVQRPFLYRRILRRLTSYWAQPQDALSQEVSREIWKDVQLSTIELSITTQNNPLDPTRKEDFMNICIEADTISKGNFITIGSRKVRNAKLDAEGMECLQASQCTLLVPEGAGSTFSIDSEEYEVMPVEVKLLPRNLPFFCDPRKREQMLASPTQ